MNILPVVVGIASVIGTVTGVVGIWAILRSSPHRVALPKVLVSATNLFPVYNQPDGGKRVGEQFVGVQVINHGPAKTQITSAGLAIKGHGNMIGGDDVLWQPKLPAWLEPGGQLVWWIKSDAVRTLASELGVEFSKIIPYACLADSRTVKGKIGVPLK